MAVFSPVWRMRPKGRPWWCFKRTRMPVRAAELGWGFEKLSIDPMAELLSKGKEGHGGMAYKKTPDLAVSSSPQPAGDGAEQVCDFSAPG